MRHNVKLLTIIAALVLLLTPACALGDLFATEPVPPPTPSITPKPTFTATPAETPTPIVAPTNTPTLVPTPTDTPAEPTATDTPAEPTPTFTPEAIPTSEGARLIIDNPILNVRQGPGTNYSILGQARDGERYDVTGRNSQSSWWQINYNGQNGWVSGSYVILEGDRVIERYDICKAGYATAQTKSFEITVADSLLNIEFVAHKHYPKISAIAVQQLVDR